MPKKPKQRRRHFENGGVMSRDLATMQLEGFNSFLDILPDPDEILKGTGKHFSIYRKIMHDSQIRACISSRRGGVKALEWDINRGRGKDRITDLIIDFYRKYVNMDEINDAILMAPLLGFQPIEIIWGVVDGYIIPQKLIPKNQEWFQFDSNQNLKIKTFDSFDGTLTPPRKFLTPTHNDINNRYYNPYGDRVLASCFWPATFKRTGLKWWVTFAEKYGMPYLIGKIGRHSSDEEKMDMKDSLRNMVQDAVAVIEEDSDINFVSAAQGNAVSSSSGVYKDLIEMCNREISKAILGQTLTTDVNSNSGSYALGKVHSVIRRDVVMGDKRLVENTHNQLIKWIVDVNFGVVKEYPKMILYLPEDVDKERAERDAILAKVGVEFKKEYLVKAYGFDSEDIEINKQEVTNSPYKQRPKDPSEKGNAEKEIEKNATAHSESHFVDFILDPVLARFSDMELKEQIKGVVSPILKTINNSKDFEEVSRILETIKPEMDDFEFTEKLGKLLFISELIGRQDVIDERSED